MRRRRYRKKSKIPVILVLLIVIIAGAGVLVYWIAPEWLPFYQNQLTASNAEVYQPFSGLDAPDLTDQWMNQVSNGEVQSAMQSNYNDNFQSSFQAEAAYVTDENGNVLYAKNEHTRMYPASTTKMMTAYLAVTHTEDLDRLITVAPLEGCYEEGSLIMYLEPGDQISMRDLLHALLLCSYNDSATAIAMEVGGSLEGFAKLMNEQLEKIGAADSHFVTPHGLHDEQHYTTAYDLNLILQMAYGEEEIREIMLTPKATITIVHEGEPTEYEIQNSSFYVRGLYDVPSMEYLGGKTGYTSKAGSCLASVFEQAGTRYFSTIMKSEDASYMTAVLFDFYFSPEALPAFSKTVPLMRD